MALAAVLAGHAKGDALVDEAVVADDGGLANDDAHAVVNHEPAADLGRRVDFHPIALARVSGDEGGQRVGAVLPEPVGAAVGPDGVHAGVPEDDVCRRVHGGVALDNAGYVLAERVKH